MIWLTWRQFRPQAVTAAAALAAFAILLAATGPHLASQYAASGIIGCHGVHCGIAASNFLTRTGVTSPYPVVYAIGIGLILAAPAIIGIFWGAPLVAREFETRTFTLAWNQSITRTRWLLVKLGLMGLAAMAATEALSLMYAWWADPIAKATGILERGEDLWRLGGGGNLLSQGRFGSFMFATSGITPLGYAAFGFALGTAMGALIRRALPAMAITLAIFAAAQITMPVLVRPHLLPPHRMTATIESAQLNFGSLTATVVPGQPGAWLLSSGAINAAGRPVSTLPGACAGAGAAKAPSPAPCMQSRGFREAITYQPASRYWPFQWIETGIFLVLALALAGLCVWRIGRRRT